MPLFGLNCRRVRRDFYFQLSRRWRRRYYFNFRHLQDKALCKIAQEISSVASRDYPNIPFAGGRQEAIEQGALGFQPFLFCRWFDSLGENNRSHSAPMCNAAVAIRRVEASHVADLDKPINESARGDIKMIWITDFESGLAGVGNYLFKMSCPQLPKKASCL
ncbi:hypothetical protein ACQPTN_06505 [Bradyrhizobium sp. 13971]